METEKFVELLKQFANQMRRENSPHLIFWSQRMANDVHNSDSVNEKLTGDQSAIPLVHHRFTLADKELHYLPLSLEMPEERRNREFNEECLACHSGVKGYEDRLQREEHLRHKESWIVKKIFSIPKDLMTHVNVISQRTKIPTESLMEIINLISTDKGSYKLFGEVFSVKNIDVSIPKDVPLDDRDKLVMEAWSMLYDLLLEALCLIVMMGTVEYTRLLYYLRYQPEEFFSHLLATAVYPDQEDRITTFQTPDDTCGRCIYDNISCLC